MNPLRRLANSARLAVAARRERRVPFLPPEEIGRLQRRRLRRTLRHARETVPFWRVTMEERGLDPEDFASAADLARLPLLDERTIRSRLDAFRSTEWRDGETLVLNSSASAHGHVRKAVHWDPRSQLAKLAWYERDRAVVSRLAGRERGLRQLWVLPAASESLKVRAWWDARVVTPRRLVERERLSSSRPFEDLVERLAALRPTVVYSYGSYAERFFRWLEGSGLPATMPRVWVYGGDAMEPLWRRRAEERGCFVLSTYQCVEAGRIGFECERRDGFHLNVDLVAVRIVDDRGREAPPGETGEIVVSSLVNRATVLLNARLGDRGALSPDPCPCGRRLPLLARLEGRVTETLSLEDGREIDVMTLRNEVRDALDFALQVQALQPAPGRIVWRVAPLRDVDVAGGAAALEEQTREVLGPGVEVAVEVVEEIPLAASGKARNVERNEPGE